MALASLQCSVSEKLSSDKYIEETSLDDKFQNNFINTGFSPPEAHPGVLIPCLTRQSTKQFVQESKISEHYPYCATACPPCLPVSKGCIKKTAQTRFVNSSPRSYRLMPASVESSDMTSFVEKSSHNHTFPMFMLDVAELWKLSKRSELECNFTLAKSKLMVEADCVKKTKNKTPICHSSVIPTVKVRKKRRYRGEVDFVQEISNATLGRDLFSDVKKFFGSQGLKEQHPMGIAGFMKTDLRSNEAKILNEHLYVEEPDLREKHSLTPLVKRLSVSGYDEPSESSDTNSEKSAANQAFLGKKTPTSFKRSSQKISNCDEPVKKRANCASVSVNMDVT